MAGPLTPDEVIEFLDQRAEWAVLTSIDAHGYPHSVPLGYFRIGDSIYLGTHTDTQKVRNLERNPRITVLVETGDAYNELRGISIDGEAKQVQRIASGARRRGSRPSPTTSPASSRHSGSTASP